MLAVLVLLLWISAGTLLAIGFTVESLSFLRWVALPDGIAAVFATFLVIRRSILE